MQNIEIHRRGSDVDKKSGDGRGGQPDSEKMEVFLRKVQEKYPRKNYHEMIPQAGYEEWNDVRELVDGEEWVAVGITQKRYQFNISKIFYEIEGVKFPAEDDTTNANALDALTIPCPCGKAELVKMPFHSFLNRRPTSGDEGSEQADAGDEDSNKTVICDGCFQMCPASDGACFHCPRGLKVSSHRGGYDLCLECAREAVGLVMPKNLKYLKALGFLGLIHLTAIEKKKREIAAELQSLLRVLRGIEVGEESKEAELFDVDVVKGIDVTDFRGAQTDAAKQEVFERKSTLYWSRAGGRDAAAMVMIGKTGNGKSTLCNRLAGDESFDGSTGGFPTSSGVLSCTDRAFFVHMLNMRSEKLSSIIDLPGLDDSAEKDDLFIRCLIDFFSSFPDGRKIFVMVLNSSDCRVDANIQQHFKLAEALFGQMFWRHLVVVLTKMDLNNTPDGQTDVVAAKLRHCEAMAQDINTVLRKQFKKIGDVEIPVLNIGQYNFVGTVNRLYELAEISPQFEHELLRKLSELKKTEDIIERQHRGEDIAQYVRQLISDYDSGHAENIQENANVQSLLELDKQAEETRNSARRLSNDSDSRSNCVIL